MQMLNAKRFAGLFVLAGLLLFGGVAHADTVPAQAEPGHHVGDESQAGHGEDHGGHHAPTGAPSVNWTDMGYGSKNSHGGDLKPGDEPMAPPLLLALLNFAIFAGLLYWKAGPAIRKYTANRHESIKSALEEAARLQEEAKEKMKEYSARIADVDSEVNSLIGQIRKDAEEEKAKIVADAEKQAERMRKDAEARIESEFAMARRELERDVIAKAVEVAEKALAEKTTAVDHNTLFTNFISGLKADAAKSKEGGLS